jgi:hypothetical protein
MMRRRRLHVASGAVHDPLSCFLDLSSATATAAAAITCCLVRKRRKLQQ